MTHARDRGTPHEHAREGRGARAAPGRSAKNGRRSETCATEGAGEARAGAEVPCLVVGVADVEVPDAACCMAVAREYLGCFPLRAGEKPPRLPCADPAGRRDDSLLDVIPESPRQAYDVKKIISRI